MFLLIFESIDPFTYYSFENMINKQVNKPASCSILQHSRRRSSEYSSSSSSLGLRSEDEERVEKIKVQVEDNEKGKKKQIKIEAL